MINHPTIYVVSLVIIFLLIALTILKEMIRVTGNPRSLFWMRILNFTIAPFFVIFVLIILLRFVNLFG